MATDVSQAASSNLGKRKVALMTGITGQVIIINNKTKSNLFYSVYLGWQLFD